MNDDDYKYPKVEISKLKTRPKKTPGKNIQGSLKPPRIDSSQLPLDSGRSLVNNNNNLYETQTTLRHSPSNKQSLGSFSNISPYKEKITEIKNNQLKLKPKESLNTSIEKSPIFNIKRKFSYNESNIHLNPKIKKNYLTNSFESIGNSIRTNSSCDRFIGNKDYIEDNLKKHGISNNNIETEGAKKQTKLPKQKKTPRNCVQKIVEPPKEELKTKSQENANEAKKLTKKSKLSKKQRRITRILKQDDWFLNPKLPKNANVKPYYTDGLRLGKLLNSNPKQISIIQKIALVFCCFTIYIDLIQGWIEIIDYFQASCITNFTEYHYVMLFNFAIWFCSRVYYQSLANLEIIQRTPYEKSIRGIWPLFYFGTSGCTMMNLEKFDRKICIEVNSLYDYNQCQWFSIIYSVLILAYFIYGIVSTNLKRYYAEISCLFYCQYKLAKYIIFLGFFIWGSIQFLTFKLSKMDHELPFAYMELIIYVFNIIFIGYNSLKKCNKYRPKPELVDSKVNSEVDVRDSVKGIADKKAKIEVDN